MNKEEQIKLTDQQSAQFVIIMVELQPFKRDCMWYV